MSYKYGNTTTRNATYTWFEDFVEHSFQKGLATSTCLFNVVPFSEDKYRSAEKKAKDCGRDGFRYYTGGMYEDLYFGKIIFLGKQLIQPREDRKEYPWGFYRLVRLGWTKEYTVKMPYETIILEDAYGNEIEVRIGSMICTKKSVRCAQAEHGFWFPPYLKEQWPDLVEYKKHMRIKNNPYEIKKDPPKSPWRARFDCLAISLTFALMAIIVDVWVVRTALNTANFVLSMIFASPIFIFETGLAILVIGMMYSDWKEI